MSLDFATNFQCLAICLHLTLNLQINNGTHLHDPLQLCNKGVPIYRISKISFANMTKFSISAIGKFYNCTDISTSFVVVDYGL